MSLIFGSAVYRNKKDKPYQDRSRLYTNRSPLVKAANRGQLFVVADGLGSVEESEIAADIAVKGLIEYFTTRREMKQILYKIHRQILLESKQKGHTGIGTTIAGVLIEPDFHTRVFNMGDSPIIQCREKEIIRRSEMHIDKKGILTSCLGGKEEFSGVYQEEFTFEVDDQIAIFSDGALEEKVELALRAFKGDPMGAANEAAQLSSLSGSTDDITVIVLERESD